MTVEEIREIYTQSSDWEMIEILLGRITFLEGHLSVIAGQTLDVEPPFRVMPPSEMVNIAQSALKGTVTNIRLKD